MESASVKRNIDGLDGLQAKRRKPVDSTNKSQIIPATTDGQRLRCLYILTHKGGRQCNMTRRKGDKYCAQHKPVDEKKGFEERIPCPINPRHNIRKSKLNNHIKKCQSIAAPPKDPWYSPDMNIVDPSCPKVENAEFSSSEYQEMAKRLNELWETLWNKEELELEVLNHDGLKERLTELEIPKHATQQASLIGHMEKSGLLGTSKLESKSTIIAEFGCGRAELSRYVARSQLLALTGANTTQHTQPHRPFLLIDRAGPRMKFDTKILKDYHSDIEKLSAEENEKPSSEKSTQIPPPLVKRALIDIKDLDLNVALNTLFPLDLESDVVAISKHLCGCATDLTLQCLANNLSTLKANDIRPHKLKGLVIALCCRQLCSYETYPLVGRKFLVDNGLITTPESFRLLTKMTSWAICGRRDGMDTDEESTQNHPSGLSVKDRERAGLQARRAIDHGRLLSLSDMGYQSKLIRYVGPEISLENVALIAR